MAERKKREKQEEQYITTMKNLPLPYNLQIPPKIKAIGFFAMSMMCLTFLLLLLQVMLLQEEHIILKIATYCTAAIGSVLLLVFVILVGLDGINRSSGKK